MTFADVLCQPAHGLRDDLRAATRCLHDRVEALWAPAGKFGSRETYIAFLATTLRTHRQLGLAAAIARGDADAVIEERARIAALEADLGLAPHPDPRPRDMDPDYAWGVGYVLNGSSLGAAALLKNRAIAAEWPRRYLRRGRDYARGGHLRRYFYRLDTLPLAPDRVRRGALDTFDALRRSERAAP